ncbi:unnamed protein product [Rotaria socialis]|uniref:Uncharacterized protein n=1 Tax=Rotaria socialis TaxID=392032 RepID=A0A820WKX2_9BILA|nr:unnamed protein product [Rotaria socialis]
MSSGSPDNTNNSTSNDLLKYNSLTMAQIDAAYAKNEIPINLLPADKHPYWNNVPTGRTTIEDAQQLEYDEHHIDLIADQGKSYLSVSKTLFK